MIVLRSKVATPERPSMCANSSGFALYSVVKGNVLCPCSRVLAKTTFADSEPRLSTTFNGICG